MTLCLCPYAAARLEDAADAAASGAEDPAPLPPALAALLRTGRATFARGARQL